MKPGKLGIIFDCDGTLLDSMGMWHSLDDRIAERAGVEFNDADRDVMTVSTLEESSNYMHNKYGIGNSGAHVMKMIQDELFGYYENEVTMRAGVGDFVHGLYELGIPMSVASSTPAKYLRVGLERVGLASCFRTIVSVEDVNSSKREPLVYDFARESLGTARCETWGFEDALYAVQTLSKAGCKTCAVYDSDIAGTPEQLSKEADIFIRSFTDITPQQFIEIANGACS